MASNAIHCRVCFFLVAMEHRQMKFVELQRFSKHDKTFKLLLPCHFVASSFLLPSHFLHKLSISWSTALLKSLNIDAYHVAIDSKMNN
jgi:hypothetical protein